MLRTLTACGVLGLAACLPEAAVRATPMAPVAPLATPCPAPPTPTASAEPERATRTASGAELPTGSWKEIALPTVAIHFVEEQAAEAER